MGFRSEAAYSLDWRDRRKYSVRVRTGGRAQACALLHRRDRCSRRRAARRHKRHRRRWTRAEHHVVLDERDRPILLDRWIHTHGRNHRLDGFDKALIREGRFDVKMRLDLRDDLVIPAPIQGDLQSIIRLLEDPARTRFLGLEVPTGLLLVGHGEQGRLLLPV